MATVSTTEVENKETVGLVNRPEPSMDRQTMETTTSAAATGKRQAVNVPTSGVTRVGRGRRGSAKADNAATRVRFFLLTKECVDNGTIMLADEVESEEDALVASLVQGVPFVRIETWIAAAQKRADAMVIERRPQQ